MKKLNDKINFIAINEDTKVITLEVKGSLVSVQPSNVGDVVNGDIVMFNKVDIGKVSNIERNTLFSGDNGIGFDVSYMYSDRCNSKYSFLPCDRKEMYILNDIMIDVSYSYSELLTMVKELQEELKGLKEGVTV